MVSCRSMITRLDHEERLMVSESKVSSRDSGGVSLNFIRQQTADEIPTEYGVSLHTWRGSRHVL